MQIRGLVVGDWHFRPYAYEESVIGGERVMIIARVLLSEDDHDRLVRSFQDESGMPVVRQGISDDVRTMRWGDGLLWSRGDNGVKQQIVLVDTAGAPGSSALQPHEAEHLHVVRRTAFMLELLDALLDHLKGAGILTEAAIDELRNGAWERAQGRRYGFLQVGDLDQIDM